MNTNDTSRDRIEAAERMLHHARQQHTQGHAEDTVEFLRAARRNIDRAIAQLERSAEVVDLRRTDTRR